MDVSPCRKLAFGALTLLVSFPVWAGEVRVAVASNFSHAIREIANQFEKDGEHTVRLSAASTGKQYAQIINGAPFDIFFAADSRRPKMLEDSGTAITGSRFTFALGKLALWSASEIHVDERGEILGNGGYRHLAIANPKLAPYGRAAREVLENLGLWDALYRHLVQGENIGQTYQYIHSGNAELGFVAFSQLSKPGDPAKGSWWIVPQTLYSPVEQQAVLLRDSVAAKAFADFVRSKVGREIIRTHGYDLP